jgi:L-ascorbate metabolism protein UlaG (beta-lactamase superfamily)
MEDRGWKLEELTIKQNTMEITWLGWSSFKVKTSGKTIYFDPVSGSYDEPADLILISHGHSDHTNLSILSKIRKPDTVLLTSNQNSSAIKGTSLLPGESKIVDSVTVKACHAYNIVRMRAPGSPFHPKGFSVGWILESEGKRIYHLGDTELIPEMKGIGAIDVMLVPISGIYVMDVDEAVKAVKMIRPKFAIPMHFGVFDAMDGAEHTHYELNADPEEFAQKLKGITEVRVLDQGESITI